MAVAWECCGCVLCVGPAAGPVLRIHGVSLSGTCACGRTPPLSVKNHSQGCLQARRTTTGPAHTFTRHPHVHVHVHVHVRRAWPPPQLPRSAAGRPFWARPPALSTHVLHQAYLLHTQNAGGVHGSVAPSLLGVRPEYENSHPVGACIRGTHDN